MPVRSIAAPAIPQEVRVTEADIFELKILYEKLILEKFGLRKFFNIGSHAKRGGSYRHSFAQIIERCRRIGVTPEQYLVVMFQQPAKVTQDWSYPYLGYLAGDVGFSVFKSGMEKLGRAWLGAAPARDAIRQMSPLNLEQRFTNCFYNGFQIMRSSVEFEGMAKIYSLLPRFVVFLANADIFTPEFVVMHSQFNGLMERIAPVAEKKEDIKEIVNALKTYVKPIYLRTVSDRAFEKELLAARIIVREREEQSVLKMFGHLPNWRDIWLLLV